MKVPGPTRGQLLLGLRRLSAEPLEGLVGLWKRHGDLFRVPAFRDYWVAAHPDHARHILRDHRKDYDKGDSFDELRLLVGDGLLTAGNDAWVEQRRLLSRAFTSRASREGEGHVTAAIGQLAESWDAELARAPEIERKVSDDFARLTLRISSSALLGADASGRADELGAAFARAQTGVIERMTAGAKLPMSVPSPANLALKRSIGALDTILADITRVLPPQATGFVSRLASESLEPRRARDEAMTFLLAGYDTTSNALAWTAHLLATHPDAQEQARASPDALDGAIAESLRLYPPVPIMLRDVAAPDELGGFPIAPGSVVACVPYLTHRHPGFWTDPERFLLERWPGASDNPAYFPFGVQPRACIGEHMARLWMRSALSTLLSRFRLAAIPGGTVKPIAMVTLLPKDGLHLRISRV